MAGPQSPSPSSSQPPQYQDYPAPASNLAADPLLYPGEAPPPRAEDDVVPDDFKYTGTVSGCHLSIRQAFIRKVYTILSLQLLITLGVGAVITMNAGIRAWTLSNQWLFWVSLFGSLGLLLGTYLTQRSYPKNLIFLFAFTLCEAYLVGVVSSLYDTRIVIQALIITVVVFAGLTAIAMQTKYDFTGWAGVLSGLLWFLIAFGFVMMFFPYSSMAELIYSGIGALVFSAYILFDTQQIMNSYHPEDEIPAAIALYLDLINLFLNILRILQQTNDN